MMHLHCNRAECPSHQDADTAMEGGSWLVVHPWSDGDESGVQHFCGPDCLIQHYAGFEVPASMPAAEGGTA